MLSKRTTLAVLCAAALVACDAADSISGPSGPTGPNLSGGPLPPIEQPPIEKPPIEEFLPGVPVLDPFALFVDPSAGDVEWARGKGDMHLGPALRTFAFVARNRADGTTRGSYQIDNRETGIREQGTVTCLEVLDNRAWIGGIITHSSDPSRVGMERVFSVVDNGEGSDDPPDQTSLLATAPAELCRTRPIGLVEPLYPIESGDIEVRDAR